MTYQILQGNCIDVLKGLPAESIRCSVSSPPYFGLRDYGTAIWVGGKSDCTHKRDSKQSKTTSTGQKALEGAIGDGIYKDECKRCGAKRVDLQIGLEKSPEEYVQKLVLVYREIYRVLTKDGTLWVNIGDSYSNLNRKSNINYEQVKNSKNGRQNGNPYGELSDGRRVALKGNALGLKDKDLIGIPWMLAFALRADGWYLRSEIIWAKPNPMPESVKDRPTKSHETIFLFSKSQDYYYDYQAILEPANYGGRKDLQMKGSQKYQNGFAPTDENPQTLAVKGHARWSNKIVGRTEKKMAGTKYGGDGPGLHALHSGYKDADGTLRVNEKDGVWARNKRSVWTVPTKAYEDSHFATYPAKLIEPCILAGSEVGDTVLDPFSGTGTTGEVSLMHHRKYIGIDLSPDYVKQSHKRLAKVTPVLFDLGRINV